MNDLLMLLRKIREHPELYLGEVSLKLLRALITGYILCEQDNGKREAEYSSDFQLFVEDKFDVLHSGRDWASIIYMHAQDDREALYIFYELLDDFLASGGCF